SHLATDRKISASTRKQALNAAIFLYKHVLDMPVEGEIEPVHSHTADYASLIRPTLTLTPS
ncbi:MAG: phage integrase N-terminal SAM-like domain-containing protein, partial [Desulfobulbaceae bacterium]|nr:phage integrase N-terminal SAM-like domain-containing protein [Desulfobulbaceae bacterium]